MKILLTTTALHQPWNVGDWDMTDGNTYAINKHLNDQEDWDALQEVTAELEQLEAEAKKYHDAWLEAEAQVVELEAQVEGCLAVIATERDEVLALRRKLAEAVQGLEDALEVGMAYSDDRLGYDGAIYLLNRLKGEQDDN